MIGLIKRRNGQRFTVQSIGFDGTAQVIDSEGHIQQINLSGRKYVDYAWVSTTYGSQGKTADQVMALMDSTTTNRESFYVTVSRAKQHLALYTANKVALSQWAEVSKAKENTSDYVPLAQAVKSNVVSALGGDSNTSPTGTQAVATTISNPTVPKSFAIPDEITHKETESFKAQVPPPESNTQPSIKQKSLALWQQYSQELTVRDPVNLDLQVARRALKDGQPWKDIALMLSAGSPMVRRILQEQNKQQAMIYVNQTVRKIISFQTAQKNQLYQQRRSCHMELGNH